MGRRRWGYTRLAVDEVVDESPRALHLGEVRLQEGVAAALGALRVRSLLLGVDRPQYDLAVAGDEVLRATRGHPRSGRGPLRRQGRAAVSGFDAAAARASRGSRTKEKVKVSAPSLCSQSLVDAPERSCVQMPCVSDLKTWTYRSLDTLRLGAPAEVSGGSWAQQNSVVLCPET